MEDDLKWLIGICAGFGSTFLVILTATFRNLSGKITSTNSDLSSKITSNNRDLHARIDDVKEKYVRRDDLDGHIGRIDQTVRELREEMRENHRVLLEAVNRGG